MNAILPKSDPRTERVLHDYAIFERDSAGKDLPSRLRSTMQDEFANVAKLAGILCKTSMAFISFVGDETQWIAAREGLDLVSSPRSHSFCAHAMLGSDPMVVPDARLDPRFAANPFVTGAPFIRFYVGTPLRSPEGVPLGSLCVADSQARDGLTDEEAFGLKTLAAQIMAQLESRRNAAWRTRIQRAILDLTSESGFVQLVVWNLRPVGSSIDPVPGIPAVQDASSIRSFLATIHAGDRDAVIRLIVAAIQSGGDMRADFRVEDVGKPDRRTLLRGRIVGDAIGNRRFAGVMTDVTEQREAERASADSENRFRLLADTMPQMVWSTRPDGFHDYYNARWYEFTGVPEGSTDGEAWDGVFHAEDQPRAWERWRHSLETGEPYEIEYRLRHRSGQYRWALGRALPIRNERGEITRWFGTCTDIHDSKQAGEERELVAQELSHRIKNTFLVISGLIGLYARNDPAVRPFANEMRDRIMALGRAHNFVRPHSRQSRPVDIPVTLRGLIAELIAPYRLAGEHRIHVSGDDLAIDDRAATPLALLLHELATNATKYGSLSVVGGTVDLRLTVTDDQLAIEWSERGGPLLTGHAPADGFGSRVSRLSVESQLAGTFERVWRAQGLRVAVTIPRASLARLGASADLYGQGSIRKIM